MTESHELRPHIHRMACGVIQDIDADRLPTRLTALNKHSVNRLMVEKMERLAEVVCAERARFV